MAKKLDQPQGRVDFFKSLGSLVGGFLAERLEEVVVGSGPALLRPPGALEEFAFLTACTRCDKCVEACPHEAIQKAPSSARLAVGTPYLHVRNLPCFLCEDLPCVKACPEGALLWPRRKVNHTEVEGIRAVKMGTAVVRKDLCYTWPEQGGDLIHCRTCLARCPLPEEALRMVPDSPGGIPHPVVDPEVCTGCGLCEFGCPTQEPAITVQ